MNNLEYMFSDKLTNNDFLHNTEEFQNIKIITWYAMIKKNIRPINWFIMDSGTKISCKKMETDIEREKEMNKLNEYIQDQYQKYNNGGVKNEVSAM